MFDASPWVESAVSCQDRDCARISYPDLTAEPECDGLLRYFECFVCGKAFGFVYLSEEGTSGCSLGIPEDLRKSVSSVSKCSGHV
jgi:hypothetical protein